MDNNKVPITKPDDSQPTLSIAELSAGSDPDTDPSLSEAGLTRPQPRPIGSGRGPPTAGRTIPLFSTNDARTENEGPSHPLQIDENSQPDRLPRTSSVEDGQHRWEPLAYMPSLDQAFPLVPKSLCESLCLNRDGSCSSLWATFQRTMGLLASQLPPCPASEGYDTWLSEAIAQITIHHYGYRPRKWDFCSLPSRVPLILAVAKTIAERSEKPGTAYSAEIEERIARSKAVRVHQERSRRGSGLSTHGSPYDAFLARSIGQITHALTLLPAAISHAGPRCSMYEGLKFTRDAGIRSGLNYPPHREHGLVVAEIFYDLASLATSAGPQKHIPEEVRVSDLPLNFRLNEEQSDLKSYSRIWQNELDFWRYESQRWGMITGVTLNDVHNERRWPQAKWELLRKRLLEPSELCS